MTLVTRTMQEHDAHALLDQDLNVNLFICNSLRVSAGFVLD